MPFTIKQEYLKDPKSRIAGFFYNDKATSLSKSYADWYDPGDQYFLAVYGVYADQKPGTAEDIKKAQDAVKLLSQQNCDFIELHHEVAIKKFDGKIWLYYCNFLTKNTESRLKGYSATKEKYVGNKASTAKTTLNNTAQWNKFWPGRLPNIPVGQVDTVVFGFEDDFK